VVPRTGRGVPHAALALAAATPTPTATGRYSSSASRDPGGGSPGRVAPTGQPGVTARLGHIPGELAPAGHRYPAAVEAAAYRLIADSAITAGQSPSRASDTAVLTESGDTLRILVKIDALDQAAGTRIVDRVRDRIMVLHGLVTLARAREEIMIDAKIPCAS